MNKENDRKRNSRNECVFFFPTIDTTLVDTVAHTHTHTHIYIYTYIYVYMYLFIYSPPNPCNRCYSSKGEKHMCKALMIAFFNYLILTTEEL